MNDEFTLEEALAEQKINSLTWTEPVMVDAGIIHWHKNRVPFQMTFDADH